MKLLLVTESNTIVRARIIFPVLSTSKTIKDQGQGCSYRTEMIYSILYNMKSTVNLKMVPFF